MDKERLNLELEIDNILSEFSKKKAASQQPARKVSDNTINMLLEDILKESGKSDGSVLQKKTAVSFDGTQKAQKPVAVQEQKTRQEKTEIRKLVTKWCANYDKDYGCLPLDCPCYMLGKCWTGAYCRYFRAAVLPLDPVLERSLTVERITETRPCPVYGRAFLPDGRQRYCSPVCAGAALREQKRAYMRRKRR